MGDSNEGTRSVSINTKPSHTLANILQICAVVYVIDELWLFLDVYCEFYRVRDSDELVINVTSFFN